MKKLRLFIMFRGCSGFRWFLMFKRFTCLEGFDGVEGLTVL